MTHKPTTQDYVPLVPWFGVVLIGLFLCKLVFNTPPSASASMPRSISESMPRSMLAQWSGKHLLVRILALGGRHGLLIYLLHQPVFFAILYLSFGL